MRFLGVHRVKVASIVVPGDWQRRLKEPRVRALADSFATIPLLQRPGVAKGTGELIWGGDRLAALVLTGAKTVEADRWEMNDQQIVLARAIENARRRGAGAAELEALAAAMKAAADEPSEPLTDNPFADFPPEPATNSGTHVPETPRRGRPKSESTKQREAVAAASGKSVKTIRRMQEKAADKVDAAAPTEAPTGWSIQGSIPNGGLSWRASVAKVSSLLSQAIGVLTVAMTHDPALRDRFNVGGLQAAIKECGDVARAMEPWGACGYCKGTTHRRNCQPCQSMAWLTHEQARDLPRELMVEGDDAVVPVAGKLVPLAEVDR